MFSEIAKSSKRKGRKAFAFVCVRVKLIESEKMLESRRREKTASAVHYVFPCKVCFYARVRIHSLCVFVYASVRKGWFDLVLESVKRFSIH